MTASGKYRRKRSKQDSTKKTLPKALPGWQMQFLDALTYINISPRGTESRSISSSALYIKSTSFLSSSSSSTLSSSSHEKKSKQNEDDLREAIRLLDAAVGIRRVAPGQYIGITLSSHVACKALPIYLARPVEVESAARRLNCSEMEIGALHRLLFHFYPQSRKRKDAWKIADVTCTESAVEYLIRATLAGNRFAKGVLDWISPGRGRGIESKQGSIQLEYIRAIRDGDRQRAIQLGTIIAGSETGKAPVKPDQTFILAMPTQDREAMAANNIGYLLLHGLGGVARNVQEAIQYYEKALTLGSAAAANNLGHVYYKGAAGVRKDGLRAKQLYMLAIERGEQSSAPRNLGILFLHGAPGIKSDVAAAAHWLAFGLRQGDSHARIKCERTLKQIVHCWRFRFISSEVKRDCIAALHEAELERTDPMTFFMNKYKNRCLVNSQLG